MRSLRIFNIFKISLLVLTGLMSSSIQANNKALIRAQFILQQLNAQKTQLENKNIILTKELDTLKNEMNKKLKKQKINNKKLATSSKNKDKHIEKLREKLMQVLAALHQSEQQRLQANNTGKMLDAEVKQCISNNNQLVKMNDELIDLYGKKNCWDSIKQNEPFTGINQVEIENILQKYRFTNEDYEVEQNTEYEQYGEAVSTVPEF